MTDISNHIVGRTLLGGRPQLSDEAKQAMRLVESLVNGGLMNDHAVFLSESALGPVDRAGVKFIGEKLNSHLNHLLAAQLKRVSEHE